MGELLDALAIALKAALGFQAIFFALLAIGINVQFGYTGLLNFGQIAFAMLGGYGIAISVSKWGLPLWVGVLVGLLAAVVLARAAVRPLPPLPDPRHPVERRGAVGDRGRVGPRRAVLPADLADGAQPLGPGGQVHPRGRGRRACARQERLR